MYTVQYIGDTELNKSARFKRPESWKSGNPPGEDLPVELFPPERRKKTHPTYYPDNFEWVRMNEVVLVFLTERAREIG